MRIALVSPYFHPHIGGVESHVLALARELHAIGHDAKVFTTKYEKLKADDSIDGIPIRRVHPRAMLYDTPVTPALIDELNAEKWDIVHAHSPPPMSSYYAAKACSRTGTPFIHTHHCDPEIPSLAGRAVSWVYYNTYMKYTLKHAARIIVYTESYAATSYALWKYRTAQIPTGLDLERFNPKVDGSAIRKMHKLGKKKVVLFVGRITEHKGIQTIIEASAHTDPSIVYLLVGPGQMRRSWLRRMNGLKVADRIIQVGKVSEQELPAYYAACDILVLPSVSRLEAFGLVLVEAMASGKPVVASDMPGVRDVIEDGKTGLLCKPFSDTDLASKINAALSDACLGGDMGRNGRKLVEQRYSWAVIGKKIESLYEEVIAESKTGKKKTAK